MLRFLASLLLCAPAFAGTATFSSTDTTISLASDPAPPGATKLHMQLYVQVDFDFGFENTSAVSLPDFAMKSQHGIRLLDGIGEVGSDRVYSTPYATPLSAFDGTIDWSGTSGASYQTSATKTLAPWVYSGTPSSLTIDRSSTTSFQNIRGSGAGYQFNHSSGVATWYWQ